MLLNNIGRQDSRSSEPFGASETSVVRKPNIRECRNVGVREKTQFFERLSQASIEATFTDYLKKLTLPTTSTPRRPDLACEGWDKDTVLTPVRESSTKANTIGHTSGIRIRCTDDAQQNGQRRSYFGANYIIPVGESSVRKSGGSNDTSNRLSFYGGDSNTLRSEGDKVVNVNVTVNIIASNHQGANGGDLQVARCGIAGGNVVTYVAPSKSKSASYDDLLSLTRHIEEAVQDALQPKPHVEAIYAEPNGLSNSTTTSSMQQSSSMSGPQSFNVSTNLRDDSGVLNRPILPAGVTEAQINSRGVVLRPNTTRLPGVGQTQSSAPRFNFNAHLNDSSASASNAARLKRYSGDFRLTTPAIDDRKLYQLKTAINAVFEQAGRRRAPLALRPACFSADTANFSMSESEDVDMKTDSATSGAVNEFSRDEKRRSRNYNKKKKRNFNANASGIQNRATHAADASTSDDVYIKQPHDRLHSVGVIARRIALAKSINERTYATVERYRSMKYASSPHLFEYACIVGIDAHDRIPRILYSYPEGVRIAQVEEFAFPDKSTVRPSVHLPSETYSFVMTREDGSRYFGYCRRSLPPIAMPAMRDPVFPEVFCIISLVGANFLYEQLLTELERKRQVSWQYCCDFIEASYECQMPRLGRSVQVHLPNPEGGDVETVIFARPSDDRLEQLDLSYAFRLLGIEKTMRIYGALLLERRVVLTSSRLSMLSAVSQTIVWLLYPFIWQHTFIPILPGCLIDVLDAPTPYMVGLLASEQNLGALRAMQLDADVMVVDLDARAVVRCAGDETRVLPKRMHKTLNMLLEQIIARGDLKPVANVAIFEAFMRMYVELFHSLPDFFIRASQRGASNATRTSKTVKSAASNDQSASNSNTSPSPSPFANDLHFDRERFIKSMQSASIRSFMAWFCETQQFAVLVNDYLELNNAPARKHSLAYTQANKFLNRLYEARLNRRIANQSTSQSGSGSGSATASATAGGSRKQSNDGEAFFKQQSSSSPFGNLAAKVKRALFKQPNGGDDMAV